MSATVAEFTVAEKILLAANDLDKRGETTFTAETLIVTVWKRFPRTFGLKGYVEQYPDSNKVLSSIMGQRGLASIGWLVKVGKKVYSITRDGRRQAARLLDEDEPAGEDFVDLTKDKESFLRRLLTSSAFEKFESRNKNDLAFADACRFWDISQNLKGEAVDQRLELVEKMFNDLDKDLAQQDAKLNTGRPVTAGDVRVLRHVHRYMEDRFERILNLLRRR